MLISIYVNLYYIVLCAWALLYFFFSFESPLPWATETNIYGNTTSDSESFFYGEMVLDRSENISVRGGVPWRLALCFTVSWVVVFAIIYKGIESSGKVVYFTATFPYVIILIMVIQALTLPGAKQGLEVGNDKNSIFSLTLYSVPRYKKLI